MSDDYWRQQVADRRADQIARDTQATREAVEEANEDAWLRHQQSLKQAKQDRKFQIWWDSRTPEEKRAYQEELERLAAERAERKRLEAVEEARRRKEQARRDQERYRELREQSDAINKLAKYTLITASVTKQLTSVLVRSIRVDVATTIIGVLAVALILLGESLVYLFDQEGLVVSAIISWSFFVLPVAFGFLYQKLSDAVAKFITTRRFRKDWKGHEDLFEQTFSLIDLFKLQRGTSFPTNATAAVIVFVVLQFGLGSYAADLSRVADARHQVVVSQIEQEKADAKELAKTKKLAQEWLSAGQDVFSSSAAIEDRLAEREQLGVDLDSLKAAISGTSLVALKKAIERVNGSMIAVGSFDEWEIRKEQAQAEAEYQLRLNAQLTVLTVSGPITYNGYSKLVKVTVTNNTEYELFPGNEATVLNADGSESDIRPGVQCEVSKYRGGNCQSVAPGEKQTVLLYFSDSEFKASRGLTVRVEVHGADLLESHLKVSIR